MTAPAAWFVAQTLLATMPAGGSALDRIDANPGVWLWSHVLLLVAALAWVVVGGLLAVLAGRSVAAYAGLALVVAGSAVTAATAAADLVVGWSPGLYRAAVSYVLAPLDLLSLLTTYGLVLLALCCLRAEALPASVLAGVLIALAVPATGDLRVASAAVQVVAWVAVAVALWQGRTASPSPRWLGLVVLAPYVVVAPLSWQRAGLCALVAAWVVGDLLARRAPRAARR